jgi:bifunctional non-homologous end joining protein LigD
MAAAGARRGLGEYRARRDPARTPEPVPANDPDPPDGPGDGPAAFVIQQHYAPMLAAPGALPPAADDGDWAYEMKWDGVRAICAVEGGRIRLTSRNGNDLMAAYPELRGLGLHLGSTQAVLDGEIVAFDERGKPSFGALQQRMHVADASRARRLAGSVPVSYLLFDLVHLDGRSLTSLPYARRRELLESLHLSGANWDTPPAFEGAGAQAVRTSQASGLEGVVAKRRASAYHPGRRTGDWLKIKNIRTQEVVVVGWKPGAGRRVGSVGSLVLAVPDDEGVLRYAGNVGTGFTGAMLEDLHRRLSRIARSTSPVHPLPPRSAVGDAQWVTPRLVGEVVFTEWTSDGRMRHPSWRGLRPDKSPSDVRRET